VSPPAPPPGGPGISPQNPPPPAPRPRGPRPPGVCAGGGGGWLVSERGLWGGSPQPNAATGALPRAWRGLQDTGLGGGSAARRCRRRPRGEPAQNGRWGRQPPALPRIAWNHTPHWKTAERLGSSPSAVEGRRRRPMLAPGRHAAGPSAAASHGGAQPFRRARFDGGLRKGRTGRITAARQWRQCRHR